MFTGIVTQSAPVRAFESVGAEGARVRISTGYRDLEIGESVSVNGVCLTVAETGAGPGPERWVR